MYAGIISGHTTGGALLKCAKAGKSDGQAATQQPMLCPAIDNLLLRNSGVTGDW
jgi:hypothetical protein